MCNPIILVAEGNDLMRTLTCQVLEVWGATVIGTSNADDAADLLRLQADKITLAIIDVHLPGTISGYELARLACLQSSHLPVILTSPDVYGDRPDSAVNLDVLAKPWSFKQLESAVVPHLIAREVLTQRSGFCLRTFRALWRKLKLKSRRCSQAVLIGEESNLTCH